MADLYTVLFEGNILPNFQEASVKDNLMKLLKTDPESIEKMFAGEAVVIKKSVDSETAEKYKAAMENAGAVCVLREDTVEVQPDTIEPAHEMEGKEQPEEAEQSVVHVAAPGVKNHYKPTPNGGRMIITNIESVPGKNIVEHFGIVSGSTIRAKHIGRDLMASLKNLIGGELKGYTELLKESRKQAVERMTLQADQLGANAIVNVRFSTSSVAQGAAELYAYGTAVRVE